MAGFEVTPYGRFCLTPEGLKEGLDGKIFGNLKAQGLSFAETSVVQ
jgi:hypothetical protein